MSDGRQSPHVDVVVVSYNGRHNLEYSLPSLVGQEYGSFNVFIADNASTDGTAEWLRDNHPSVHVMPIGANVGMSAMNRVLTWPAENGFPSGDYIFVAGWDLVFDKRCIRHAIELMETNPDIGVLGFTVLGLLEWAPPSQLDEASAQLGKMIVTDVPWVPGACSVIRRDVLEIVGFIDPAYFAYAEEDDLQYRFRRAGFRTVIINTPVWQNALEASIPLERAAYLTMRNSIRFAAKNYGIASGLRQAVNVAIAACAPRRDVDMSLRLHRRSRPFSAMRNVPLVAKAFGWNLLGLRRTLAARREMQERVVEAKQHLVQLRTVGPTECAGHGNAVSFSAEEA